MKMPLGLSREYLVPLENGFISVVHSKPKDNVCTQILNVLKIILYLEVIMFAAYACFLLMQVENYNTSEIDSNYTAEEFIPHTTEEALTERLIPEKELEDNNHTAMNDYDDSFIRMIRMYDKTLSEKKNQHDTKDQANNEEHVKSENGQLESDPNQFLNTFEMRIDKSLSDSQHDSLEQSESTTKTDDENDDHSMPLKDVLFGFNSLSSVIFPYDNRDDPSLPQSNSDESEEVSASKINNSLLARDYTKENSYSKSEEDNGSESDLESSYIQIGPLAFHWHISTGSESDEINNVKDKSASSKPEGNSTDAVDSFSIIISPWMNSDVSSHEKFSNEKLEDSDLTSLTSGLRLSQRSFHPDNTELMLKHLTNTEHDSNENEENSDEANTSRSKEENEFNSSEILSTIANFAKSHKGESEKKNRKSNEEETLSKDKSESASLEESNTSSYESAMIHLITNFMNLNSNDVSSVEDEPSFSSVSNDYNYYYDNER